MFFWQYDIESGGVLLNPRLPELKASTLHEIRPVWAKELNQIGFQKLFEYDEQAASPICWRDGSRLYYRGRALGKFQRSQTELETVEHFDVDENAPRRLEEIDLARYKKDNEYAIREIFATTERRIQETLAKEGFDIASLSYSGGKDSEALIEIATRALPSEKIVVLFGDTGMEFPTTYESIEKRFAQLEELGVECHACRAPLSVDESWKLFGAPSRSKRWCCSVHKSAQTERWLIRNNVNVLTLVGVRASESIRRSSYEFVCHGRKNVGRVTLNPILDLSSAEVWTILFATNAPINEAYKLGFKRVGCLICPMASPKSNFKALETFPNEASKFIRLINSNENGYPRAFETGKWSARRDGRFMSVDSSFAKTSVDKGSLLIAKTALKNVESWLRLLKSSRKGFFDFQGRSFETTFVSRNGLNCLFTPP